jgi:DNA-directed RNA polymerase subunit RPC12/RpoP
MYIVVRCQKCKKLLLGNNRYKTRTCTNCGHRNPLRGIKIVGKANSPQGAVALIQELKKRDTVR